MAGKSELKSVGSLISAQLPPAFRIALRLSQMEQEWVSLVGPQLAERTSPVSLDKTGLVVTCDSPAAAQLLRMSAGTLIRRVARRWVIDLKGVRPVVARVSRPAPRVPVRPKRKAVPEKKIQEALERISPEIENGEIALALARFEAAAKARWGEGKEKNGEK